MSSVFQTVFGGSQNKNSSVSQSQSNGQSTSNSASNNQAYPMLSAALGGQVGNATAGSNALAGMLGVNGDPAAQQGAFNAWKGSTGYQFGLDQGTQALVGNAATHGLLNSGGTAKALDTYGQNYADTQYKNYTDLLGSLTNSGNTAGGVISGAGNQSASQAQSTNTSQSASNSNGNSSTKPGIGGFLGALL